MTRALLNLLLFLLPFLVYGGYVLLIRRLRPGETKDWADAPFGWLVLAGLVLGGASIITGAFFSGSGPDADYAPKQLIEGDIRPNAAASEERGDP